jgi:prepilin-type N-terminal cleavage/methylation domain-containing protein
VITSILFRRDETRGFSLLEVLVSLTILMVGILAIVFFFSQPLEAARNAEYRTKAALYAQMKAEEIRRDDDTSNTLIRAIESLTVPTAPITFPQDPNLAYQFSGRTIQYPGVSPNGDPGVARVIIRYSAEYRQSANTDKDVLYELRFGPKSASSQPARPDAAGASGRYDYRRDHHRRIRGGLHSDASRP